jgi:F0F1-type ATP synthase membrane subunit c/vacuolar-type H+-ATPase subunit K
VVAGTRIWEQELVEPREAVMTGVIVIIGVALFLAGVMIGVVAAVAVTARRENRSYRH